MAPYLRFAVRALGAGAIIVIIAVVSRQVYMRVAAEADLAGANEESAAMMLITTVFRVGTVPTLQMLTCPCARSLSGRLSAESA